MRAGLRKRRHRPGRACGAPMGVRSRALAPLRADPGYPVRERAGTGHIGLLPSVADARIVPRISLDLVRETPQTLVTGRDGWLASETARKAGRWPAEPPCSNSGRERSERSARLADDQREGSLGAALVTAIAPVGRHHPGPQRRLFLRR